MLRRPRHNRSSICPTFGGALILKTHTIMNKVTLTPAEISDIIDRAFKLGKTYATDELASIAPISTENIPLCVRTWEWEEFIESNGGVLLNAGDAKLEILWEAMTMTLKDDLKQYIDY